MKIAERLEPQMLSGGVALDRLFEEDETAWLEIMARLASEGRLSDLDTQHLSEYLCDMAKRDRREVFSRLVVLLTHLLKWEQQPELRSGSWRATIRIQRLELQSLLESATLQQHAVTVLPQAYEVARLQAADETELKITRFPEQNPWTLDDIVTGTI